MSNFNVELKIADRVSDFNVELKIANRVSDFDVGLEFVSAACGGFFKKAERNVKKWITIPTEEGLTV